MSDRKHDKHAQNKVEKALIYAASWRCPPGDPRGSSVIVLADEVLRLRAIIEHAKSEIYDLKNEVNGWVSLNCGDDDND